MIPLRPILFAHENRKQIVRLIVQTLKRLQVASGNLDLKIVEIWSKVDAVMTDAVSKNIDI